MAQNEAIDEGALYESAEFDDRHDDERNETQRKPKLILASYWGHEICLLFCNIHQVLILRAKKRAKMAQAPQNQQYKQKGKVKIICGEK